MRRSTIFDKAAMGKQFLEFLLTRRKTSIERSNVG